MDRRTRKSRASILDALRSLLETHPLSLLTMTDIARAADVNRSTLYAHFDTVGDIFSALAEESIRAFSDTLGGKMLTMAEFITLYLEHMKSHRAVFLEIHRSSIFNPYVSQISALMNAHLSGQKITADSVMARYCNYGFFGIAAEWLADGCKKEIPAIIADLRPILAVFERA